MNGKINFNHFRQRSCFVVVYHWYEWVLSVRVCKDLCLAPVVIIFGHPILTTSGGDSGPLALWGCEDPWHSHLLPNVCQWNCRYLLSDLWLSPPGFQQPTFRMQSDQSHYSKNKMKWRKRSPRNYSNPMSKEIWKQLIPWKVKVDNENKILTHQGNPLSLLHFKYKNHILLSKILSLRTFPLVIIHVHYLFSMLV